MSEKKIKVKDLAAELGLANKDVLTAARDLGITAKVAGSSLTDADAARVRARLSPAEPEKQQVIVRRKRQVDSKQVEETPAVASAEQTEASAPEVAPTVQDDAAPAPAVEAPVSEAAPEKSPPVARKRAPKPVTRARVISPAESPAPAQVVEVAEVAEKVDLTADLPVDPPADAPAESAADIPADTQIAEEAGQTVPVEEVPVAAVKERAAGKEKARGQQRKGTARVVSPAAFSAEPERGADGQAVSSAPAMPHRSEQDGGQDEETGRSEGAASQVRVISRPDPARAPQPARRTDSRPAQTDSRRAPSSFAPRSGGSGFTPPQPETDQSRKKRQKGRRTVDFTESKGRTGLDEDQGWSRSSSRRKGRKQREVAPMGGTQPVKAVKRKIRVDEFIRVADLAHQMGLKSGEIIKVLFSLGVMATINQSLDIDTASLVAAEFDYEIEKTGFSEQDIIGAQQENFEDNTADYAQRPPVVTIMGHVDHGKTSLLDAIRKSSVVTGEAGGITQHIGAYHVKTKKGEIVFLDTPGHEAFTAMRARGAEITDIVVLVVAADDGVMEQTKEAINHSRAAGVPIMVAVNKMDKEAANPDRVKRELADQGLVAEDWGGDTTFSYVSAKTRLGLDELLELLALQAEIMELKANPKRQASGHIVEAKLDKGRGALGTVLIQQGTLHVGDAFVCGVHSGRVRAMFSDQGKKVKEAGPSIPVEVQGFEGVPEAGEEFIVIADEKAARRIAEARALKQRERELAKESKITLETFLARKADSPEAEVLNLVLKADVQGSLEAITDAVRKLSTEKVRINVIHGGTGAISESDVLLATASNAIIIGFNVRPAAKAKELAEQEKVDIRFYDIIYKLVDEIKNAMEGMLAPVEREAFLGTAEVRETFSVPKVGLIAGCHVSDGKITRNARVRLLRDGVVVHTGKISSLRRFKDDVREVAKGYECGIGLENYNDVKVDDVVEAFEIIEEAATL
ncbi:translation initiation factor IF-2 [Desulfovibrio sp. OttesenSCG-928-F20]|nr:translation initiation factor IF-2 [Desulfovibrio sp. OttesenSCG-928-F20]